MHISTLNSFLAMSLSSEPLFSYKASWSRETQAFSFKYKDQLSLHLKYTSFCIFLLCKKGARKYLKGSKLKTYKGKT